jgi:hypothetical protein
METTATQVEMGAGTVVVRVETAMATTTATPTTRTIMATRPHPCRITATQNTWRSVPSAWPSTYFGSTDYWMSASVDRQVGMGPVPVYH